MIVWLPKGSTATNVDFDGGERWPDLDDAVIHARECRQEGMDPWIRYERKFVLSPEDIVHAYAQSKLLKSRR